MNEHESPEAAVRDATTRLTEALADLIVASGRLRPSSITTPPPAAVDYSPVRLYSVAAVAKLVGTAPEYVYGEIRAGRLRKVQLGNGDRDKSRVRGSDLAAWIDERYEPGDAVRLSRRRRS